MLNAPEGNENLPVIKINDKGGIHEFGNSTLSIVPWDPLISASGLVTALAPSAPLPLSQALQLVSPLPACCPSHLYRRRERKVLQSKTKTAILWEHARI